MPDFSWANQWLNCREFIPILATSRGLGEPPADGLQHFTASDGPTPPQPRAEAGWADVPHPASSLPASQEALKPIFPISILWEKSSLLM